MAPVFYHAWHQGKALRRWLSEVTGLSQMRLSDGQQSYRSQTLVNARRHSLLHLRKQLTAAEYPASLIAERIAGWEKLEACGGAAWASYWYAEAFLHAPLLNRAVDTGVRFDNFLAEIERAVGTGDLAEFRSRCVTFTQQWGLPADVANASLVATPAELRNLSTWDDALKHAQGLLLTTFLDQFAQFDAVWGGLFIEQLQPRALVPLIAPKQSGEGRVVRPVRRLIVLSFALHYWIRFKRWPDHEPRRSEMVRKLTSWSTQDIANLFDGSKRMRLSDFKRMWDEMGHAFDHRRELSAPYALARIAIAWQKQLVNVGPDQKLRSFFLLGEDYQILWAWRKSQLPNASQGPENWPQWMGD